MKQLTKKTKTAIAVILAALIVLAAIFFILKSSLNPDVVKSDNYGLNADMIEYLISDELDSQIKYYENDLGQNYLDAVSLDAEKSLKSQYSPYGESWFDYFYGIATDKAKGIILACELAKKANISLTEEEKTDCDNLAKSTSQKSGINRNTLKKLFEYEAIAEKYKDSYCSELDDSDYKEYYGKNSNNYNCVDYKCVTVQVDVDQSLNGGKSIEELTEKAKKRADRLLEDIRAKGFGAPVKEYLKESGSSEKLKDLTFSSQKYIEDNPFLQWAFSGERKAGDTVVLEGKHSFSVYLLEKTPYPYDYVMTGGAVAVKRYGGGKTNSLGALKRKINESGKSENDFDKFTTENGFEMFKSGMLAKDGLPQPVSDWMYSAERKAGDRGICIFGKKVYATRYSGETCSYFDYILKEDCRKALYDAMLKKASGSVDISVKNVYKIFING